MRLFSDKTIDEREEEHPLLDWADAMICASVLCMIVFSFFIKTFTVVGPSMLPNYVEGERVIAVSLYGKLKSGDVVVTDEYNGTGDPLIKRVLAVEGDEIYIEEDGTTYLNGSVYEDVMEKTPSTRKGDVPYPIVVPEGTVFLLGDNRSVSYDSRYLAVGCIPVECVVGKVIR